MGRVVEKIVELWGADARVELQDDNGPHETGLLTLDSTLAQHKLGWQPRLRLSDALSYTVEWYKRFGAGESMDAVRRSRSGRLIGMRRLGVYYDLRVLNN